MLRKMKAFMDIFANEQHEKTADEKEWKAKIKVYLCYLNQRLFPVTRLFKCPKIQEDVH